MQIDNIKLQTVDILTRIEYMRRLKKKGTLRNNILKQKLAQLEEDLQRVSDAQNFAEIQRVSKAYADTQAALEQAMDQWAVLAEG